MKKHVPNILTLANLFCGIYAIMIGLSEHYYLAGFFVLLGAFFDFFDGFVARILKVQGELGKQLDSLADMVTFGVAPGVVMYSFLKFYYATPNPAMDDTWLPDYAQFFSYDVFLPTIAFLIPLLSAVRLAKFNIDTNQSDKFIGLPTPANAMFFVFLPLAVIQLEYPDFVLTDFLSLEYFSTCGEEKFIFPTEKPHALMMELKYVVLGLIVVFSVLLNSPIELIALKFKTFGWKGNEMRFVFIGLCLVVILFGLLISSVFLSVPIIILLYIVLSVINNLIKKNKNELQS